MDFVKNIRTFSLLGQRGTFGTVLDSLAQENEKIYAMTADLCRTSGLDRFKQNYPDRFLNVGIAEQNMVGVAAGLADNGYIPFVTTFANFATLRANEFVRHFMAYMKCNIKLVGLGSGFAMELFGNTHYGLEDIAVLRSMPNITILSPADGLETAKCVEYAANNDGPIYLRLSGRMNNPIVYKSDFDFKVGKGNIIREGNDIIIYATGSMVSIGLKVAENLESSGITSKVVDIHTIKPIDADLIIGDKDKKLIVTIEEHFSVGGLGSSVAECLATQSAHGQLLSVGVNNKYEKAGSYEYMLNKNGLNPEIITSKIIKVLGGYKND